MTKELFEKLKLEGRPSLRQLVDERHQESLSLEFKTKEDATVPELSNNDKKNYGKILSAFSNSSGGLLLWGIKATEDADGVDAASDIESILNPRAFESKLTSLAGDLLDPINDEIEICSVNADSDTISSGCVAIWIPRSERRPHRSRKDHHYYKRSGDSSYRMEHFDLEDMFLSRKSASLNFSYEIREFGRNTPRPSISVIIGLANASKVTAKFPYLSLSTDTVFKVDRFGLDGNGYFGLPKKLGQGQESRLFSGGSDDVLNPGQELWICKFNINYDDDEMVYFHENPLNGTRSINSDQMFGLDLSFGCEGMEMTTAHMEIDLSNHI